MDATLPFWKMEGCGNDFVVLRREDLATDAEPPEILRLCDRRRGVGADGVLVVDSGTSLAASDLRAGAVARMWVWNADGSVAETCGNGLRCVVRRLDEDGGWPASGRGMIATLAGPAEARLAGEDVEVAMGCPMVLDERPVAVDAGGCAVRGRRVLVGNPHFVVLSGEQPGALPDLLAWGPLVETAAAFPDRTNVEWVEREAGGRLRLRVWERGAGETEACGSGACAAAAAARVAGLVRSRTVALALPGGELRVDWAGSPDSPAILAGPARTVFKGFWRSDG